MGVSISCAGFSAVYQVRQCSVDLVRSFRTLSQYTERRELLPVWNYSNVKELATDLIHAFATTHADQMTNRWVEGAVKSRKRNACLPTRAGFGSVHEVLHNLIERIGQKVAIGLPRRIFHMDFANSSHSLLYLPCVLQGKTYEHVAGQIKPAKHSQHVWGA
ncbi:hypothetical protein IAQ61_003712, partial [Plenodomus lingam]|uniref:Predicted protein n=1 Tax=Leptosphaeria maculans (strain JN3 / isolate v23.1.3 / race Av1-4-5-6-7-8) TaxID=985895 RepID=E4ZRI4_LEPMJ